jgi:hypothetical protein
LHNLSKILKIEEFAYYYVGVLVNFPGRMARKCETEHENIYLVIIPTKQHVKIKIIPFLCLTKDYNTI